MMNPGWVNYLEFQINYFNHWQQYRQRTRTLAALYSDFIERNVKFGLLLGNYVF